MANTLNLSDANGLLVGSTGYYSNGAFTTTEQTAYDAKVSNEANAFNFAEGTGTAASLVGAIDASKSTAAKWTIESNYATAITGSTGADTITSGASSATVNGGAGNDSIVINGAFAVVNGGAGDDSIVVGGSNALVYASTGSDVVNVNASGVTVDGSANSSAITIAGDGASASVAGGSGNDSITLGGANAYVNGGAGADAVLVTGASSFILASSGADVITISGAYDTVDGSANTKGINVSIGGAASASVNGGDGADTISAISAANVTVNGGAGKDTFGAITGANASIYGGAGNDTFASINNASASVDGGDGNDTFTLVTSGIAYGGAGNDTIAVADSATDATIGGGDGADIFDLSAGTTATGAVSIYDYTYGVDKVKVANNVMANNATGYTNFTSDGSVHSGNLVATPTSTSNYYTVDILDGTSTYHVWYTGSASVQMDASAATSAVYMTSANNGDVSDTLIGGSKGDAIAIGAGDYVYGGAGNDTITLTLTASSAREVVGLAAAGGKDTVESFGAGFADGNDAVYLFQDKITSASISYAGTNVTIKDGAAQLTLQTAAAAANYAEVLVADSTGTTYKVDVANANNVIELAAGATTADIYVGAKAGGTVNFANITDDVAVDLGNTGAYGSTSAYYNITTVTGGSGSNTLIGAASTKDSIVAGAGNSSLWGGGSAADTLVGGSASDAFFYGNGDGNDVIKDFKLGTGDTADKLYLLSSGATAITSTGGTASITWSDGSRLKMTASTNSTLTAANDAVQFNVGGSDYEAMIGQSSTANTFTYDSGVSFYYGGKKGDTLKFASDSSDDANIWLDGSQGKTYNGITILDGSNNSGNIQLAGNAASNTITGGKGSSSLWGGTGSVADTLVGGSGTDTFYFGKAEGNDVITSSSSDDKVMLYNVSLSDIKSYAVTNGVMKISLNDGSSLSIKNYTSNSANTFTLGADNTTYTYDNSAKTWTKA